MRMLKFNQYGGKQLFIPWRRERSGRRTQRRCRSPRRCRPQTVSGRWKPSGCICAPVNGHVRQRGGRERQTQKTTTTTTTKTGTDTGTGRHRHSQKIERVTIYIYRPEQPHEHLERPGFVCRGADAQREVPLDLRRLQRQAAHLAAADVLLGGGRVAAEARALAVLSDGRARRQGAAHRGALRRVAVPAARATTALS